MKVICFLFLGFLALTQGASLSDSKIVGGNRAAEGQFKYQASLRNNGRHFCGGSIISARTILTAAHCVRGSIVENTVVVGTIHVSGGGVSHPVSKIITHPSWDSSTLQNDIALYIVQGPIVFNDLVQPIALPTYNIGDDVAVVTSGWGLTQYPSSQLPTYLQWITLRTYSHQKCRQHLGNLTDKQLCTLTKAGEGVCSGDSGGPLVANNQIHGVTSAAFLCALGRPDFFTRVIPFKAWILNNMEQ